MQFVMVSWSKLWLVTFLYIPYCNATIYKKSVFALIILRHDNISNLSHLKGSHFLPVEIGPNSIKIILNSILITHVLMYMVFTKRPPRILHFQVYLRWHIIISIFTGTLYSSFYFHQLQSMFNCNDPPSIVMQ